MTVGALTALVIVLAACASAAGLLWRTDGGGFDFLTAHGVTVTINGIGLYLFDTPIGALGFRSAAGARRAKKPRPRHRRLSDRERDGFEHRPPLLRGTVAAEAVYHTTFITGALGVGIVGPSLVVCGALLLRRNPLGCLLAPVLLVLR